MTSGRVWPSLQTASGAFSLEASFRPEPVAQTIFAPERYLSGQPARCGTGIGKSRRRGYLDFCRPTWFGHSIERRGLSAAKSPLGCPSKVYLAPRGELSDPRSGVSAKVVKPDYSYVPSRRQRIASHPAITRLLFSSIFRAGRAKVVLGRLPAMSFPASKPQSYS